MGKASLITAIISWLTLYSAQGFFFLAYPVAVSATVMGIVALRNNQDRWKAIFGIVISLLLYIPIVILVIVVKASGLHM